VPAFTIKTVPLISYFTLYLRPWSEIPSYLSTYTLSLSSAYDKATTEPKSSSAMANAQGADISSALDIENQSPTLQDRDI
jgi:hypothetical protein